MTDDTEADAAPPTEQATKREGHGSAKRAEPVSYLVRGSSVGRYVVLEQLGEGGMGVVYSAFDPELDRKVAIKLMQASAGGSMSGGEQAWLLREAQALARLSHPNVVSVHDVGTLPGDRVFIAMELVDGVTLREWLKQGRRHWRDVVPIMVAAGKGLAAAHAAGLVHRDFKPDNVLVGNDGRTRVMDFGLARLRVDEAAPRTSDLNIEARSPLSESLTMAGTVVGTPAYMAPEVYHQKPASASTDQFAFGVTLFEALFGTRPFRRDDLKADAPPKPKVPSDTNVPARIQKAVLRAIAADPAQRFPTMDALLAELEVDPHATRRRVAIAAAAVVVVAGAGGAVLWSRAKPEPCQGIEQRFAGVWDATIKKKISAAFAATKVPYAPQAFAALESSLDGYAKTWVTTAADSCRATRVRRDQTEEVMTLRQMCLDQRLEELGSLTQLLAEPDAAIVDKAEKIGAQLEPIAVCSNIAVLRSPGVRTAETRAKLAGYGKHLAEARANVIAGRYLPGLVQAQKAIDVAKAANDPGSVAEASLVRGAAMLASGNPQEAASIYQESAWTAMQGKRDDLLIPAALMEAMVSAEVLGKPGEAKLWLDLADAMLSRLGLERVYEKQRYTTLGVVEAHNNNNEAAIAAHEKAFEVAKRAGGDELGIWGDELLLATTLTKAHVYGKAVEHFEHAMHLREKLVGPNHPDIAMILTNLGVDYYHLGQLDKARAAYERGIAIREKAYGPKNPLLVATLNNYADFLKNERDWQRALDVIDRAVAIAQKVPGREHPLYHLAVTTRAEIIGGMGRVAEARKLFDDIVALEESSHSESLPVTQEARATLELGEQKWADAQRFAEQAIAAYEKAGGTESSDLFSPLVVLARAKLGLRDTAGAKSVIERALAIGTKAGVGETELKRAKDVLASLR